MVILQRASSGKSLIYSRNRVGTRMELWGTAALTKYSYKDFPSRSNQSRLLRRKDQSKPIITVERPTWKFWSTWTMREKCPNTEFFLIRIFLYLNWYRIQSKYSKIRTRKNYVFGHFSCSGNSVRYEFLKKTSMPDPIETLGYIKCHGYISSPRTIKSPSKSIRYNCQNI